MVFALFPFKYYAVLPESTLATRIRQESWKLDRLFPLLKESKKELKKLKKSLNSNPGNIPRLQHAIALLAAEIRTGMGDLKRINFYDSTILYLYYKLLHHVNGLCKSEHSRLSQKTKELVSKELKLKNQKIENIKKAKGRIERNIKQNEKSVNGLAIGKAELARAHEKLVSELKKARWKAEKQAQHEFAFSRITFFRSLQNLNRKVKVAALKVKKGIPQKNILMARIRRRISSEDVVMLARLVSRSIESAGRDVAYSSKLISKFEKEIENLKKDVENLKKAVSKLVKNRETAEKITKPWDDALKYLDDEINKDLMQVFRNAFVLYKKAGTDQLPKAA